MESELVDKAAEGVEAKSAANDEVIDQIVDALPIPVAHMASIVRANILANMGVEIDPDEVEAMEPETIIEAIDDSPLSFYMGVNAAINSFALHLGEYASLERMREQFPQLLQEPEE